MKNMVVALIAAMTLSAVPVLAEHPEMKMQHEGVRQCALQAESIQEKIKRLETEVAKGTAKYSKEDLANLRRKLKEANDLLDQLNKN